MNSQNVCNQKRVSKFNHKNIKYNYHSVVSNHHHVWFEGLNTIVKRNILSEKVKHDICSALNIANAEISKRFVTMSRYLGLSKVEGLKVLNFISKEIMNSSEMTYIESMLRNFIRNKSLEQTIDRKLDERAKKICSQIKQWISGSKILDIGSGDGRVAKEIYNSLNKKIYLVDIMNFPIKNLPFFLCDGQNLPFADDEFDTSLLLTTLHHADSPISVLKEALRVTKKRLVIIESVHFNKYEMKANLFFDWLCNRIEKEINIPFNFRTSREWKNIFDSCGVEIVYDKNLGFDQPLVPERHWLCILNKEGGKNDFHH